MYKKGSTMCHFPAEGLGSRTSQTLAGAASLKVMPCWPRVQDAENTEGVKKSAAIHPSQAASCSLSQLYRPKYCQRVSGFKERLRVCMDLVPMPIPALFASSLTRPRGKEGRKEMRSSSNTRPLGRAVCVQLCQGMVHSFLLCKILLDREKTRLIF